MAEVLRSSIFAAKEEVTEGTLIAADSASFIPMREGASMTFGVETLSSDELYNSIGESKNFIAKESPSGSFPKYARHSGVEGTTPEYGVMIKSAMGAVAVEGTERTTSSSSTAGTTAAAAVIKVSDGTQHAVGKALLIKDNTNGWRVRNISSISSNDLTLAFNIPNAPASGIGLGKPIHYYGANAGHPSFSAHMWQAETSGAVYQAIAGCKTTRMQWRFPANGFAESTFDYAGIKGYLNPITITSSNKYIDFNDGSLEAAALTEKIYQSPHELAREVEDRMNEQADTLTFTCLFDDATGKFTISAGGTFTLLFATGTNAANDAGTILGFSGDQTSAATYTSATAQTYTPPASPTYDDVDNLVVKGAELMIGDFHQYACRKFTECSFTIDTPSDDIVSGCSENGIDSRVQTRRTATFSSTILLAQHEAGFFDKMINNTSTKIQFTCGDKSSGNWTPGTVVNIFFRNCTVTAAPIGESSGVLVYNLEARAHVDADSDDVHINFL